MRKIISWIAFRVVMTLLTAFIWAATAEYVFGYELFDDFVLLVIIAYLFLFKEDRKEE